MSVIVPIYNYLPPLSEIDTREEVLLLLGNPQTLPFTKEQASIFSTAIATDLRARRGLGWRGYTTIIGIPVTLALFAMLPFKEYLRDDTGGISFMLTAALVALSIGLSNIFGMLLTGSYPDASSNAKNAEQDELDNLKDRFEDVASYALFRYKICIWTKDEQGKENLRRICQAFLDNCPRLQQSLERPTTQRSKVPSVFNMLIKNARFIASDGKETSFDALLESIQWNKEMAVGALQL
jgi:hypothetical protein